MGTITVVNHVTLDGVMQAPGRADEDTRGGFTRGGWAQAGNDAVMARVMAEGMKSEGSLLLGRRTYEAFFAFWPAQTDNPYTDKLNAVTKYVASSTLDDPLPWSNSISLGRDAVGAVAELRREGPDLMVLGSGELIAALSPAGLIDRWMLLIHPLVLGTGRRLFPDRFGLSLRLTDSVTTTTGVVIATYEPAEHDV